MKLESVWRTRLKEWVQGRWGDGAYLQMAHGNEVSAGLPDIQVLVGGQVVWLELKAVRDTGMVAFNLMEQPTKLQTHTMLRIHKAGGNARVLCFHNDMRVAIAYPIAEVVDRRRTGQAGVLMSELRTRCVHTTQLASDEATLRTMLFGT